MTQTTTPDGRERWLVPSASQDAPRIVIRHAGALTCDCPAGLYRRPCRHVLAVQTLLATQTPAPQRDLRAAGIALLLARGSSDSRKAPLVTGRDVFALNLAED